MIQRTLLRLVDAFSSSFQSQLISAPTKEKIEERGPPPLERSLKTFEGAILELERF